MRINPDQIHEINRSSAEALEQSYSQLADQLDRKNIDKRAVKTAFERLLAENPEGSVVIQADKDAYTETVVAVADAARQAKISRVSISGAKDE